MVKANNSAVVKKANRCLVLNSIMEFGAITMEDIMKSTGLSRPTVLSILKILMEENLILKSGFAEVEVGRQPALISLNTQAYYAIGIDLEFPPVHLSISDLGGNLVYNDSWEIPLEMSGEEIARSLVAFIESAIKSFGLGREKILGLGLGVPAINDIRNGSTLRSARVHGWDKINIDKIISENTGLKVCVRNDAHLLGMVEKKRLKLDSSSFLYVVHRMGIGAATFINGKLYEGMYGNSGQLGHTIINLDGALCECGNIGCLELYCSKRAVINSYNFKAVTNGLKPVSKFKEVLDKADSGDELAKEILTEAGRNFGIGISNTVKLFDISKVVIGDLHCKTDNPFFLSLAKSIANAKPLQAEPVQVLMGTLDEESYGLGGCYFIINSFFEEPKLRMRV